MGIKGIDHWVIVAGDLHRTLDFYQKLGFAIAWEKRPGRPDMATIRISNAQKINVMVNAVNPDARQARKLVRTGAVVPVP